MSGKDWQYQEFDGRWSVRGSYEEPNNIQYLLDGRVVHTLTVPGYRIWNYAAHLHDVIPELERLVHGKHSEEAAEQRGEWLRWHDGSEVGVPAGFYHGGKAS